MVWYSWVVILGFWTDFKTQFKLSKIAKLKVWFLGVCEELWNSLWEAVKILGFSSDQLGLLRSDTKPWHLRPIFWSFWPILLAENQFFPMLQGFDNTGQVWSYSTLGERFLSEPQYLGRKRDLGLSQSTLGKGFGPEPEYSGNGIWA